MGQLTISTGPFSSSRNMFIQGMQGNGCNAPSGYYWQREKIYTSMSDVAMVHVVHALGHVLIWKVASGWTGLRDSACFGIESAWFGTELADWPACFHIAFFVRMRMRPKTTTVKFWQVLRHWRSSGWWFGTFFSIGNFPIGNNHPNWLSYFSKGLKPPSI